MPTGRAITPELHIPESAAVAAGQPQPAHLAAQRRCPGAVDLGITAQAHHVAPALAALEPTEQLSAVEAPISQTGDAAATSQQLIESTTTQQRFHNNVVSRARCKLWQGFCQ
jgi:hypothetical protein